RTGATAFRTTSSWKFCRPRRVNPPRVISTRRSGDFFSARAVDRVWRRSTDSGTLVSPNQTQAQRRRNPMQYMLLIYDNEKEMQAARTGDVDKMMASYREFTDSIVKSGNMKAGDALQPTSTATCVRIRNGKTLTTDGPFAETKEQLGGYYLIEAKDLDEATKIAARVPSARTGTIEVRPVRVFTS